jgi:hypothetical protein
MTVFKFSKWPFGSCVVGWGDKSISNLLTSVLIKALFELIIPVLREAQFNPKLLSFLSLVQARKARSTNKLIKLINRFIC